MYDHGLPELLQPLRPFRIRLRRGRVDDAQGPQLIERRALIGGHNDALNAVEAALVRRITSWPKGHAAP